MTNQSDDKRSEWCPAIVTPSQEELEVLHKNSSLENKMRSLKTQTKESEEEIIQEFKKIEEKINNREF
jgi:proteasome assembly chaperone (PAC2) family protein